MFIYNGKFNWLDYASDETITVVFPAGFALNDPVSAYWQWTVDAQGNKKPSVASVRVAHLSSPFAPPTNSSASISTVGHRPKRHHDGRRQAAHPLLLRLLHLRRLRRRRLQNPHPDDAQPEREHFRAVRPPRHAHQPCICSLRGRVHGRARVVLVREDGADDARRAVRRGDWRVLRAVPPVDRRLGREPEGEPPRQRRVRGRRDRRGRERHGEVQRAVLHVHVQLQRGLEGRQVGAVEPWGR